MLAAETRKDDEKMTGGKKIALQVLALLAGGAMVLYGISRGEPESVLSKAIKLCLECVGIG